LKCSRRYSARDSIPEGRDDQGALVAQGIAILTKESAKGITRDRQNKLAVKLSSGNTIKADMIVVAAG
jgi:NAD(P)H-nitrite reductase large subunit